jgi:hypothetical protein
MKQYRIPNVTRDDLEKQVTEMLENEVIEESASPWCQPVLMVEKRSETGQVKYRFCIDYRKLNERTIKDAYLLPRIDDTVEHLSNARYFSTLDLASGYWQVPLREGDREKTAFAVNNKLYHFRVMPFGLCNAPSTFQRLMDRVLRGLTWQQCLVYLDDVIIFAPTIDIHNECLRHVFDRIREAGQVETEQM